MEESSCGGSVGGDSDPSQIPRASTYKGKSCKGGLYYSSVLKSNGRKPVCIGISRTLPQAGSLAAAREKGFLRSEGKDYIVQEGDVILFRFNVWCIPAKPLRPRSALL